MVRKMKSMFKEVIVCYDITEDKRRNKFFERMKDFGLISIQKSIFWGYVNTAEERAILNELRNQSDPTTDRGFIVKVRLRETINKNGCGYSESDLPEDIDYGSI